MSLDDRRACIDIYNNQLSISHQCNLLGIAHSSQYYRPVAVNTETLALMNAIDRKYTELPFYGILKMTVAMNEQGFKVNHKKIARLMRLMGVHAIYAEPKLSIPGQNHIIYPYLLTNISITSADHVWSTDITYVPMLKGFMYCVAVIDWYSRYVLAWSISNTQDAEFCVSVLNEALRFGTPRIFNTDQGSQFTSDLFIQRLLKSNISISMDGRGRALDNVFIERLWRSLKYEDLYLHNYSDTSALRDGMTKYFEFYNHRRYHQALNYRTPADAYFHRLSEQSN
jgi:putative transposase